jgi:hypothetical protein
MILRIVDLRPALGQMSIAVLVLRGIGSRAWAGGSSML